MNPLQGQHGVTEEVAGDPDRRIGTAGVVVAADAGKQRDRLAVEILDAENGEVAIDRAGFELYAAQRQPRRRHRAAQGDHGPVPARQPPVPRDPVKRCAGRTRASLAHPAVGGIDGFRDPLDDVKVKSLGRSGGNVRVGPGVIVGTRDHHVAGGNAGPLLDQPSCGGDRGAAQSAQVADDDRRGAFLEPQSHGTDVQRFQHLGGACQFGR